MTFIFKMALTTASIISLTACATSIQNRSPSDIAAKAYRSVDSYTGLEQTRLPAFSPFEWGSGVRGNAQLQTAEAFQGQEGGSWLDIVLRYDTPTPDPAEMRVYNRARWAGGEEVVIADFAAAVMNCEDRVSGYSNNNYYGGVHGLRGYGYGRGRVGGARGRGRGHDGRGRGRGDGRTGGGGSGTDTPAPGRRRPTGVGDRPSVVIEPGSVGPRPTVRPVTRPRPQPSTGGGDTPAPRPTRTSRKTPKTQTRTKPPRRPTTKRNEIKGMHFEDPQSALQGVSSASISGVNSSRRHGPSSYGFALGRRGYNNGRFNHRGGYYPDREYIVQSQCERQERIRVFVPEDRLASAERYGLNLYFRSNAGDERPVIVSPNYVMGYRMATLHIGAPRSQVYGSNTPARIE